MTRLQLRLVPTLVLIAGLGVAYLVLVSKPAPQPMEPPTPRAPLVEVVPVSPADLELSVSTQGTVAPRREVSIVSRVGGVAGDAGTGTGEGYPRREGPCTSW